MIFLNLGCGGNRPPPPWVNVDTLETELTAHPTGAAALEDLRRETNYLDLDLSLIPWPWASDSIDAVLASHFFEHFDGRDAVRLARECFRVLRPGGVLRVSVPDAAYFRRVFPEDRRENWLRLFGEDDDASGDATWMSIALFFWQHKQVYAEDALWCQLVQSGFNSGDVCVAAYAETTRPGHYCAASAAQRDNRARFSIFAEAFKRDDWAIAQDGVG